MIELIVHLIQKGWLRNTHLFQKGWLRDSRIVDCTFDSKGEEDKISNYAEVLIKREFATPHKPTGSTQP